MSAIGVPYGPPLWPFLYPRLSLLVAGAALFAAVAPSELTVFGAVFAVFAAGVSWFLACACAPPCADGDVVWVCGTVAAVWGLRLLQRAGGRPSKRD